MDNQEKQDIELVTPVGAELSFWEQHRLFLLLIITVCIAIVLTVVSISMYNSSGAAQLDFSRPGYSAVSDQVEGDDVIDEYSGSGPVNKDSIEEFMKLYNEEAQKAKAVDAFNGDPLNPEVLEFNESEDK